MFNTLKHSYCKRPVLEQTTKAPKNVVWRESVGPSRAGLEVSGSSWVRKFWVESTFLNKLQVSADSPSLFGDSNWRCGDSYTSCRLSLVFLSGGILNIITHGFSLPSCILPKILCVFETEFPIGALAVLELLDQADFKLP